MQYLHDEQHYIDLYDLGTIEKCLNCYLTITSNFEKKRNAEDFKEFTKKKFDDEVNKVASYPTRILAIERFRSKAKTLNEWIDRDKRIQEHFDKALPPIEIYCKNCIAPMNVISKDFIDAYEENSQVIFMFECIKCKKKQVFYENGTEWHSSSPKCPKCNAILNKKSKLSKNILTTFYSCPECSYKEKDDYDFKQSDYWWEKKKIRDENLLKKFRKEFCLDDKQGPEEVRSVDMMAKLVQKWKEQDIKDNDPMYQKAKQLQRITVAQLKVLIIKVIEREGYKDLQFDKPEMGQYVVIPFTVQEANSERKEYDTTNNLKKLLKKALEDTNWRLMTEGVSYRLGYVYGRLKGYEREDDLANLMRVKPSKDEPVMIDEKGPIY
jgi:hypothetical protein